MPGVKVTNLAAFDADVQKWFGAVEKAAAEAAVGLAREALDEVLTYSPQYSGDFVANWKVGRLPINDFQSGVFTGGKLAKWPLFQMGSREPINYAKAHARWPRIKLGETIYLSNSAAHDEPYAFKIEEGTIRLRPVNEGAAHVVRRAVLQVSHHYSTITGPRLDILRKVGR